MKVLFVLCLLALHGCTSPPPFHNPALHDGRWGDYNEGMAEQCASASLLQGAKHKLSNKDIDKLFGQCLLDQGLTI
jgi:hypothetical protein